MNNRNNRSKETVNELEKVIQFIDAKKIELDHQSFTIESELKELNTEMEEYVNTLEVNISRKDANRSLFSPYADMDNNTEKVLKDNISEIQSLIIKQNDAKEKNTEEKEFYQIISKLINDKFINTKEEEDKCKCEKENKDTYSKNFEDLHERFDEFGKKIIEAQELERKRIARDLHDSTVQNLTGLIHKAELCSRLIDVDTIRTKLELLTMKDTIKKIVNDMRSIIYDLRPMTLADLGLVPTIESFLDNMKCQHGIQTKLQVVNEEVSLSTITNLSLFRVIQEACNNTVKHAMATTIIVKVEYGKDSLKLTIQDDGKGFNVECIDNENKRESRSFGLSIMNERIFLLSGTIKINSKINEGTMIVIEVPYCTNEGRV